MTVCYT